MAVFHQQRNSIGNHAYNVHIYNGLHFDLHFHKNHEIIYVMDGTATVSVNGKEQTLRTGDFAFCLSNEIHAVSAKENSKVWIGVFSEDFIHEFKKYRAGKVGSDFIFRCSDNTMDFLIENLIKEELSNVFLIKACLYALCSEYLRQIPLEKSSDKHTALMGLIVEYVENHYKEEISLSDVAQELGYDYFYFSKIFNRLFTMSFNDYINMYRFNEACAKLTETDMKITNIATESGFKSVRSFNYIFKKLSDLSPREYRSMQPML